MKLSMMAYIHQPNLSEFFVDKGELNMTYEKTLEKMRYFIDRANGKIPTDIASMAACCTEALEKQIPKKPVRDKMNMANLCPACNNPFTLFTNCKVFDDHPNYCDACGQAIDWRN